MSETRNWCGTVPDRMRREAARLDVCLEAVERALRCGVSLDNLARMDRATLQAVLAGQRGAISLDDRHEIRNRDHSREHWHIPRK